MNTSPMIAAKPSTAARTFTISTMSTARGMARAVSRWRLLAISLLLAAIACAAVAAITREEPLIEGAYLNRSVGEPATSSVFSVQGGDTPSSTLTAIAAALMLAVLLLTLTRSARRRAP